MYFHLKTIISFWSYEICVIHVYLKKSIVDELVLVYVTNQL